MSIKKSKNYNVLSLFSSAGIGELGVKAAGMNILVSNELLSDRCEVYRENYPDTNCICGDIWRLKNKICNEWKKRCSNNPFLVYATPPCQGMSFNSVGKRQQEIRRGRKLKVDPRNQLIIPTLEIIKKLNPEWVIFENVEGMQNTVIPIKRGKYINIIEYIRKMLGNDYVGGPI